MCANRLYVQDSVYDAFAAKLVAAVEKLKVGNGMTPGVTQGPLIDGEAVQKIELHISDALAKGGHLLTGGKRHALGHSFFEPTVLANAHACMLVAREESFGPLAPLFRFKTDEEVIGMANDTDCKMSSRLWSWQS